MSSDTKISLPSVLEDRSSEGTRIVIAPGINDSGAEQVHQSESLSNDFGIRVSNLGKCYHIYDRPEDRLKQALIPRFQRLIGRPAKRFAHDFWALKDVSFEVKKGETVGIIGRNGSGKSTLLQLLCGTLAPTTGRVEINGRIAALLELGSGFNPQFTGRENIYINAAILGLSKEETEARFDEIAAFADIGEFMDQPVKTYSSGMGVRLAFAVQTAVNPDVLIVDEALAVGDAPFQAKCFTRMRSLISNGTTVLFVSHDLNAVRTFCSNAIYLKNGILHGSGSSKEMCDLYTLDCINAVGVRTEPVKGGPSSARAVGLGLETRPSPSKGARVFSSEFEENAKRQRSGSGSVQVVNFYFESLGGEIIKEVTHDQHFNAVFVLQAQCDLEREVHLAVAIKDLKGVEYMEVRDSHYVEPLILRESQRVVAKMRIVLPLRAGQYYATAGMLSFGVGEKYKDGRFDFPRAELCDLVEYAFFFSVKPFSKFYIRSAVHQESKLEICTLDDM